MTSLKKILSFILLSILIGSNLTFARSSSSSFSSSSRSYSSPSSYSSRSYSSPSYSSSSSSRSYSSSSSPSRTSSSSSSSSQRNSTSSTSSSWLSPSHLLFMYLLLHKDTTSQVKVNNITPSEKQKILDSYNSDPTKYDNLLYSCNDTGFTNEKKLIPLEQWKIDFIGFENRSKYLSGESVFTKFAKYNVQSLEASTSMKSTGITTIWEWGCPSTKYITNIYTFGPHPKDYKTVKKYNAIRSFKEKIIVKSKLNFNYTNLNVVFKEEPTTLYVFWNESDISREESNTLKSIKWSNNNTIEDFKIESDSSIKSFNFDTIDHKYTSDSYKLVKIVDSINPRYDEYSYVSFVLPFFSGCYNTKKDEKVVSTELDEKQETLVTRKEIQSTIRCNGSSNITTFNRDKIEKEINISEYYSASVDDKDLSYRDLNSEKYILIDKDWTPFRLNFKNSTQIWFFSISYWSHLYSSFIF